MPEAQLPAFFGVFGGPQLPKLLNRRTEEKSRLLALIGILLAVVIGLGLAFAFPAKNGDSRNEDAAPRGTVSREETVAEETVAEETASTGESIHHEVP